MVSITNNTKNFIENNNTPLVVYGAGTSGYWTGHYLEMCGIDFDCYIDKAIERDGALYGNKPVYRPKKLLEYGNSLLRVIVTAVHYESVIMDLMWFAKQHNQEFLCLVPRYWNDVDGTYTYDINQMLAYFRSRLIRTEIPTIFSTDCSGGVLYAWLGWEIASPTINTSMSYEDFLRLCTRPEHYLSLPLEELEWCKLYFPSKVPSRGDCYPQGIIDDIRVQFGHSKDAEKSKELWNMMRTRVNLNRVIAVMTERQGPVPLSIMRKFAQLDMAKFLLYWSHPPGMHFPDVVELPVKGLHDRTVVLEEIFDFVGWINGDHQSDR